MNFHSIRRPLMLLVAIPLSLALGLAAFAIWTSNSISQQQITAGSGPQIVLSSTSPNTVTGNGLTLTFAPYSDAQPTFTTGDEDVTINNNGSAAATLTSVAVVGTPGTGANSTALNSELSVCMADGTNNVLYNGLLSGVPSGFRLENTTIPAGGTLTYLVNVYAGDSLTYCGSTPANSIPPNYGTDALSTAPILANDAQGGIDNISVGITYQ